MLLKQKKEINLYQFNNLADFKEISHYVSGRVANNKSRSFNLSYKVGANDEVSANRALLAASLGVQPECLIFPDQTHSTNVRIVHNCNKEVFTDTDAIITTVPGICVSVMSADCVPILLYDPIKKVVAAIHAGWRGTVGKIAQKALEVMSNAFSCNPSDIIATIGPSICAEVYEVGDEVVQSVKKALPDFYEKVLRKQNEKIYLDLWVANKLQLMQMGVSEASIEVAAICTYNNIETFFSARKEGISTGRFAAGILLKE